MYFVDKSDIIKSVSFSVSELEEIFDARKKGMVTNGLKYEKDGNKR